MFDISKARKSIEDRENAETERNKQLFLKASEDANAIIKMIIEHYRPGKIIQWGSVLDPEVFDSNSDIDIAVSGIADAETFFKLLGEAMVMTDFSLDIVQLEKIEVEFAEIIKEKGKVVYEHEKDYCAEK